MKPSNLEILAYEETPLGPLCLRRRELLSKPGVSVTEVTLNHEFLMSSYNTDSERAIAGRSVEIHGGQALRVLVGGLGLGYTAHELVRADQVASVAVVEFLPDVIQWLQEGLVPLSRDLVSDSGEPREKLSLVQGDIYECLADPPAELFDVIVIDVDHSPSDQLGDQDHGFYNVEGLTQAKSHLREGGVLAVWSYAENSRFSEALHSVFRQVHVEPVRTVNDLVGHEQTDWLFFGCR